MSKSGMEIRSGFKKALEEQGRMEGIVSVMPRQ